MKDGFSPQLTADGHLVFWRRAGPSQLHLCTAVFDPERATMTGEPVPVLSFKGGGSGLAGGWHGAGLGARREGLVLPRRHRHQGYAVPVTPGDSLQAGSPTVTVGYWRPERIGGRMYDITPDGTAPLLHRPPTYGREIGIVLNFDEVIRRKMAGLKKRSESQAETPSACRPGSRVCPNA